MFSLNGLKRNDHPKIVDFLNHHRTYIQLFTNHMLYDKDT